MVRCSKTGHCSEAIRGMVTVAFSGFFPAFLPSSLSLSPPLGPFPPLPPLQSATRPPNHVPVEHVELERTHNVEHAPQLAKVDVVARRVDHDAAPRKARVVLDGEGHPVDGPRGAIPVKELGEGLEATKEAPDGGRREDCGGGGVDLRMGWGTERKVWRA